MPREGTRSQTGNSRPRIFHTVDTGPTISRKKAPKQNTSSSLKSKLTPKSGAASQGPKKGKNNDDAGVMDRVRSAVGLAPREPKRVQKKSGVKRAVQKVKAAAKIDDTANEKKKAGHLPPMVFALANPFLVTDAPKLVE